MNSYSPVIVIVVFIVIFFVLINVTITPSKRSNESYAKKQSPLIGIVCFAIACVIFYATHKSLFENISKRYIEEKPVINEIKPSYEFSYNPEVEIGCEENLANLMLNTQVGDAVILATDTLGEANDKLRNCGINWKVNMPYKTEDGRTEVVEKGRGPYNLNSYMEPGNTITCDYLAVDRNFEEDLYVSIIAQNKTSGIIQSYDATIISISVGTLKRNVYSDYYFAIPYVSKDTTYQNMKVFMNQHYFLTNKEEIKELLQVEKLSYQYDDVRLFASQKTGRFIQAERQYKDNIPVEKEEQTKDYLQGGDPDWTHFGGIGGEVLEQ